MEPPSLRQNALSSMQDRRARRAWGQQGVRALIPEQPSPGHRGRELVPAARVLHQVSTHASLEHGEHWSTGARLPAPIDPRATRCCRCYSCPAQLVLSVLVYYKALAQANRCNRNPPPPLRFINQALVSKHNSPDQPEWISCGVTSFRKSWFRLLGLAEVAACCTRRGRTSIA